jgi:hypothetical protein
MNMLGALTVVTRTLNYEVTSDFKLSNVGKYKR